MCKAMKQYKEARMRLIAEQDGEISSLIHEIRNTISANQERYHLDLAFDVLSISSYMRAYEQSPDIVVIHYREAGTRLFLPQWQEELAISDIGGAHDQNESAKGADIKTCIFVRTRAYTGIRYTLVYEKPTHEYWENDRAFVESINSPKNFDPEKVKEYFGYED